ncbi:MAG: ribosome biogenesis GTPase Der [Thiomargarita sp.]|nr:ribosome biogenesis GTPase Der [Thiomargarita sp.]
MIPTIAIVGRPNVGKSTLFNVFTKTRNAIVANQPGLTRDRQYGRGQGYGRAFWVIDTGGLGKKDNIIDERITQQVLLAIEESDYILFLVDARSGLTALDEEIAQELRRLNKPIHLILNKAEGLRDEIISADFQKLGFAQLHSISAVHRQGIRELIKTILSQFPEKTDFSADDNDMGIKIAVIGRPNVGKSTLVNRILGYERVITYDQPGTTRDSLFIPFVRDQQAYTLIDTAGVRRRSKVSASVEKFSVIKALQAVEASNIAIIVLDASEGITTQDTNLLGYVLESGRALIIAMNKWDGLESYHREQIRDRLDRKLHFIDFAQVHFISALHGSGVENLLNATQAIWQAANRRVGTSKLNQALRKAVANHEPPLRHGRRIKLRYANQGGHNPPLFIIHGNQVNSLPDAYKRYLMKFFREVFSLDGTPIRLEFKQTENPFKDRKNILTPSQLKKRQRMIKHVKKK